MSKTFIHTALLCEAQSLINFLKLKQDTTIENLPKGNKLFVDEDNKYILIVSGIGKENTLKSMDFIYQNYEIQKAINIGIAGCCDSSIKIGTFFCINRLLPNINFAPITTVDEPLESDEELQSILVDMEAKYFLEKSKEYTKEVYSFKIVSDYLDATIPKKSFVIELIEKNKEKWKLFL